MLPLRLQGVVQVNLQDRHGSWVYRGMQPGRLSDAKTNFSFGSRRICVMPFRSTIERASLELDVEKSVSLSSWMR